MDVDDDRRAISGAMSHAEPRSSSRDRDPLKALTTVALAVKPLRRELAVRALEAREQGHPWHAIADALGLVGPTNVTSQAAYDVVKAARGGGGWWCGLEEVDWTCATCGSVVIDGGPVADERGHEATCDRRPALGRPLTVLR